jgi:fucose permease
MRLTYKTTIFACFTGATVQAIIVNFVPLLFISFQNGFGLSLTQITMLATVNFIVQLLTDLLATFFVDKIGYRISIVTAQLLSALGLVLLAVLPEILPPFAGILTAVVIYAVGGGLIEVLASPIMESCPTDNKEKAMSLLHSFYCWGHVGVVLISTAFFAAFGVDNWKILSVIWAVIPFVNAFIFMKTPIAPLIKSGEKGMGIGELFKSRIFWVLVIMMLCAGASEQAVAQWASALAEKGLGVSKAVGDLAGMMTFAVMMGLSRAIYGKFGHRISIEKFMMGSAILCVAAYLLTALSPIPVLSLLGCAICGFSVGIMWPGSLSKASAALPVGGTAMFALLALSGDIGCTVGSTTVGLVSDAVNGNLQLGILSAIVFPIVLLLCVLKRKK